MYSEEQIENALRPSTGLEQMTRDKQILAYAYREVKDRLDFIGPECTAWMKRAELYQRQYEELKNEFAPMDMYGARRLVARHLTKRTELEAEIGA